MPKQALPTPHFVVASGPNHCTIVGPFRSYRDASLWKQRYDPLFATCSELYVHIVPTEATMPEDYEPA